MVRLQSIKTQNVAKDKGVGDTLIIQMLRRLDDLVSPEDNIDLLPGITYRTPTFQHALPFFLTGQPNMRAYKPKVNITDHSPTL